MDSVLNLPLTLFADTSGAISVMRDWVTPTIRTFAALGSIVCVFFVVNSGYLYMTSSGKPVQMDHAKKVLRNALLGLVIVLSALTITSILSSAYGNPTATQGATLPNLQAIPPDNVGNGLVDVLIKAVTGFLNNIIQAVAAPFLAALEFFTKATPLMASNPSVFNLWLAIVGICNVLFAVILALIGLHVMSAASFGFDEIEFKHMLPRIGLVFVLMNSSIFLIDGIIEMSNVLINAVSQVSGASSVWATLTEVVKKAGGQGLAALLVMLAFLIFTVILLVYYVGRLVTLFIGAVISPLIVLLWLVPGFRDFSETAAKTYLSTIFVLFVHVIILILASSLFTGMAVGQDDALPDTLMSMVVGLATVLALLKTQGVMMQFSYVSMGARNARMLGSQFVNGVSYMTGHGKAAASAAAGKVPSRSSMSSSTTKSSSRNSGTGGYKQPNTGHTPKTDKNTMPSPRAKTGTSYEAPKLGTSRDEAVESMKQKQSTNKTKENKS